jgi:STE24 endopeptidase
MAQPAPPAPISEAELSEEELTEAQQYGRLQRQCMLADRAMDLVYWGLMGGWVARPVDAFLASADLLARAETLRLAGLLGLLILGHAAVSLPLSFYAGYVLEHRFGLSRLTVLRWAWRYGKQLALAVLLTLPVLLGLFWIIRWTGPWWWVVGAGAFFLLSVVLGQLAPVLILPMFYRVEKLDRPELLDRLRQLAHSAGLSVEGVYRLDLSVETVKANAALAGLGRTRRVLLADTLLDHFPADEIETIFAHELGHHVHRHIPKMLLLGLAASAGGFWLCDRLLAWWVGLGQAAQQAEAALSARTEGFPDRLVQAAQLAYEQFPAWAMALVVFLLALLSTLMEPFLNALSRHHERQADRYALEQTANPAGFIRAFRRLARLNKEDPQPPRWEVLLFYTHPPIQERIAQAEQHTLFQEPQTSSHLPGSRQT